MEHIANLTQQSLTKPREQMPTPAKSGSGKKSQAQPRQVIARLFRVLKQDFGTAWTARFTSPEDVQEAMTRWAIKLGHLEYRHICYGLEHMGKQFKRYPPNLGEFIEICEQADGYQPKCAAHREFVQLPVKKSAPETGRAELKKIASMVPGYRPAHIFTSPSECEGTPDAE